MFNLIFVFAIFVVILPRNSVSILGFGNSAENGIPDSSDYEDGTDQSELCPAVPLGGVQWILHVRQPDYGWKEDTHRAVIALTVSNWETFTKESERRLMEQQLEVEITKALLRNNSSPIYPNNLALYIQSLVATNRNPRDFHGIDLVARLMDLMGDTSSYTLHPFLLLVLCNAKSLNRNHLRTLEYLLKYPHDSRQNIEYKALALQAYECAATLELPINETVIYDAQRYLAKQQYPDGSFGNVYTTALIVQALAGSPHVQWKKADAIAYLNKQSVIEVNMVSSYLILLALNSEKIRFIKDLHPDLPMDRASGKKHKKHFVQYSLKIGPDPDVRHTITINVPPNSNFFEVMKLCAESDPKYNFSYYLDKNNEPSVYAISNIPNDAEENFYWRLCLQSHIEHVNHTSRTSTIHGSPVTLFPQEDQHVIYWYNDRDCEKTM